MKCEFTSASVRSDCVCLPAVARTHPIGPRLRYTDAAGHIREALLSSESPRVTIGRSPDTDIKFATDDTVSRLHTVVERIGSQWTIVDDGLSRNGTYLNGERIHGRRRLRPGDIIVIGTSALTFRTDAGVSGEITHVSGALPTPSSLTSAQKLVLVELCRPYKTKTYAGPATNQQIADALSVSTDTVKTHLRALFTKFGIENLPQNQKRGQLAERAIQSGAVAQRDL